MGGWTTVQDYPYGANYFAYHDMVYIPATSAYYVIGGYDGGSVLSTIATTSLSDLQKQTPLDLSYFLLVQFEENLQICLWHIFFWYHFQHFRFKLKVSPSV